MYNSKADKPDYDLSCITLHNGRPFKPSRGYMNGLYWHQTGRFSHAGHSTEEGFWLLVHDAGRGSHIFFFADDGEPWVRPDKPLRFNFGPEPIEEWRK